MTEAVGLCYYGYRVDLAINLKDMLLAGKRYGLRLKLPQTTVRLSSEELLCVLFKALGIGVLPALLADALRKLLDGSSFLCF